MSADSPPCESCVDVLIIGAGISGIGAAWHLQRRCPSRSFRIVEARADLGGTWDLFRYPGIRSDSDLYTFGYEFKPWRARQAIADGASIKAYLAQTVHENALDRHIDYRKRVIEAQWCTAQRRWEVTLKDEDTGERSLVRARWVFNAAGYYRYDQGHVPAFADQERFRGPIVHPQHWPQELDCSGLRVVVIGSGATAVTLVPALARQAAHVTMLQRTPSYILPVPVEDSMAPRLRSWLGERRAYALTRRLNISRQRWVYTLCRRHPKLARRVIRAVNARMLPKGYPVDLHFNPPYDPWEQRLCVVPGGDLFKAISAGTASVVTGHIERFTASGVLLTTGEHVEADLVVTATGLSLNPLGGIPMLIDGRAIRPADHVTFKGMLLSDLPNMAFAVGYTASSWTLKIGLLCEHFCRLLEHMERNGLEVCTPRTEAGMRTRPLLDFGAGYVQRSVDRLPRQGDRFPWTMSWNYDQDVKVFRRGRVDDPALDFLPAMPPRAGA